MKKIISYIKSEWKFLLITIIIFCLLTIKLPYQIYGPGGKIDLNDRYTGEEYESKGTLNVTYISAYPGTLPLLGLSYIISNWDIVAENDIKYDNETTKAAIKRSRIMNDVAVSASTYLAYTKANKDFKITKDKEYITYIHEDAKTDLKIGDQLLSIDNQDITLDFETDGYIKSKNLDDVITFKVLRDNKEVECHGTISTISGEKLIGIGIHKVFEYDDSVKLKYNAKKNELGPSGGLMMALYVYNALTEEDITQGKDLYGTGTIELDGTVGEIDGIKYKLLGAYKKGARYFIVPENNYEESIKVKEDNKLDIEIISVTTFDDALNKIKELK